MRREILEEIAEARRSREAVALVTDLDGGRSRLVRADDAPRDALGEVLEPLFGSGRSSLVERDGLRLFVNVYLPAPRLVVIGAVHIAQSLVPMARLVGFDTIVIDPRQGFASKERFPNVDLIADWPERALAERHLDRHTALAALTHEPRIDDGPLAEALRNDCFYVGALGSRRTHAARLERLGNLGLDPSLLDRVRAPIGLDIGAVSPPEIAAAILAEMILARRKPRSFPIQAVV
ncbi:XdhC family protein [Terrihabitans sp. B22-R8]|uniref:XdhC family protein n=1 Tax=Terrihabitans sp. B22-R8 TaxID=3425128 RepID=UPI00403CBAFA